MTVYPCRSKISREIDQCTSVEKLETLMGFCSGCIYRIFEEAQGMNIVCHDVRPGGRSSTDQRNTEKLTDNEMLPNVC